MVAPIARVVVTDPVRATIVRVREVIVPAWATTVPGATTATLTKLASTGSGNASAQVQVEIRTPHSIGA